jgi:hypothetical protein
MLLSAFFINFFAFSQIKVIETKPIEKLGKIGSNGINDFYVQKEGDEYTFFYKNIDDNEIDDKEEISYKSFNFKNVNNDYESFYTIITNGMKKPILQDIKLEMPNDFVWLHYTRNTQRVNVQFITSKKVAYNPGISNVLSIDDVNRLFNK